ncbi:hypothetical protein [Bacteroides acidifaciens]|uniref:hypothetical protein n=1 Tax=Bacteroides acidifaciens TaxID=85831 RepID=UPI0025AE812C|nr:hypothetical protein [Bacteroides acidifaciens]
MKDLKTLLEEMSAYFTAEGMNDAMTLLQSEITERDNALSELTKRNEDIRRDYTARFLEGNAAPNGQLGEDFRNMEMRNADDGNGDFEEVAEMEEDKVITMDDILITKED